MYRLAAELVELHPQRTQAERLATAEYCGLGLIQVTAHYSNVINTVGGLSGLGQLVMQLGLTKSIKLIHLEATDSTEYLQVLQR
jgi:hypothetical protein